MRKAKIVENYRIDPFFRSLLPPLSDLERRELKTSICKEGRCLAEFVVWRERNTLVDGHHRDQILRELRREGVRIDPSRVVYKSFASRFAVVRWLVHFQNARRNWTPADRAAVVLRNRELIEQLRSDAKARMLAGKKCDPRAHAPAGTTRRFLARLANCAEGTIAAVEKVLASGNQIVIDDLLVRRRLSVREAKAAVVDAQKREALFLRASEAPSRLLPLKISGSQAVDQILLADVLEGLQAIEPASVTLAFTSPPYPLYAISYPGFRYDGDYDRYLAWLQRVWQGVACTLRDGGRLVINCDATTNREDDGHGRDVVHPIYADVVNQMHAVGLRFYADICWYKQNTVGRRPNWGTYCSCRNPRIRRNHEYLLIFCKGGPTLEGDPKLCDLTPDEFESWTLSHWYLKPARREPGGHPAPFPEALAERVIRLFSYVGDTVLDPFCGSGTVPFVARKFKRRFIGIENSGEYVTAARMRLKTCISPSP